ncbi:16S rRNA (cytosine(967)-C(5))-methyltransferase RsmB [bacterium]|nr:16S rRNA (cytosine(967)-C(5))-methyltransferase RsmB [bacterium]
MLNAVEDGAFADAALGTSLRGAHLEPRDRGFATQLVYGTLAWQGLLDHVLAHLGRAPRRLDVEVRTLLRLALFQLVRLDRVPAFAAVDTAVELAKTIKGGAPSGLVNAVLRRFLREGRPLHLPPESDRTAHLAVATSHPPWLVERWRRELGDAEAAALLAADNDAAPTVLRVLSARVPRSTVIAALADAQVAARPTTYAPDGLVLETAADPIALPGWRDGWFTVQGEASQLVAAMLGARPGGRVLDVCAAPGGKALAAAGQVGGRGVVLALDLQHGGLARLGAEAGRLGLRIVRARADATRLPLPAAAAFDAVLVDAPCSGLGTLRQHPEIRWRRRPADLADLAALQSRLLAAAAPHVRPGGVLLYATCTIVRAENDDVVAAFLASHPDFATDDPRRLLPAAAHALVDAGGALRTAPHRHGLDGFFAVRMTRR